jgi:hypothetical protein
MSKNVDLIAVGILLLTFACAARVHQFVALEIGRAHVFRTFPARPIVVVPPHAPHIPGTPHLPQFPHV